MPREILLAPAHLLPGADRRLADQLLRIHDEARLVELLDELTRCMERKATARPPLARLPGEGVDEAVHRLDQLERIRQDRLFLARRVKRLRDHVQAGGSLAEVQQEAAAIARRDREHDALAAALGSRRAPEMEA